MTGFLMPRSGLLILSVLAAFSAQAEEDFATLVKKGDGFDAVLKTKEALAVYLEAEKLQPNDANLLHKIAKQYGESMDDVSSAADKKALGLTSLAYAKRSVAADPKN